MQKQSVKTDDFVSYFTHLLASLPKGQRFCFYMDNARIHKKDVIKQLVEPTGNKVIFGAPYSPDMNPIENIFGIWKRKVDEEIGEESVNMDTLVNII